MNERLKQLYRTVRERKWVRYGIIGVLIGGAVVYAIFGGSSAVVSEPETSLPVVRVSSVSMLGSTDSFSAVGTVAAVSEARLQTESGGRVVSVNTEIGSRVRAGTVLATLENSAQRAALLQAEGSYEAAVAGAEQGDSGVRDAKTALQAAENNAEAAVRDAYSAVNAAIINSVDQFFASPQGTVPGLRIDGNASVLNAERVAYQKLLPEWQAELATINERNIKSKLTEAERNTERTIAFLKQFIAATDRASNNDTLQGVSTRSYTAGLLAESSRLEAVRKNIRDARTALESAEEGVLRSEIAGTGGAVSLADAQVKVALGNLRSAQAAYEKTLVRTPITGVVNAFYLKAGQYVGIGTPAAIVANNTGLEITTNVNEVDANLLAVGDQVTIEGSATGTITAIGGAIDPTTGRVAVKVSVDESGSLSNGATVSLTFQNKTTATESDMISIPLSAVKMTGSGPVIFTVSDDMQLVAGEVTLGAISGERVVVESGLSKDMAIVVDARGLKEGQAVKVAGK